MKSLFYWLFALSPALAGAEVLRIMPLGDSLTAGGYNLNGQWFEGPGYRSRLEELLDNAQCPFEFVGSQGTKASDLREKNHEGHSGWKIDQLRNISPQISSHRPDLILLMIGTNDVFQNDQVDQAPRRFMRLVNDLLRSLPEVKIVVGTILKSSSPFANQTMTTYNRQIADLVRAHPGYRKSLFVSDIRNTSRIEANNNDMTDGVHPSAAGYDKLGAAWFEAIAQLPLLSQACRNL